MTVENLQQHRNERAAAAPGEVDSNHQGARIMPYSFPRRRASSRLTREPDPINWRRGMFRVWLLTSAAWIMGWIIWFILYGLRDGFKNPSDLLGVPVLLLGPPIALLLFGMAAGWAFRGFNVQTETPPPSE